MPGRSNRATTARRATGKPGRPALDERLGQLYEPIALIVRTGRRVIRVQHIDNVGRVVFPLHGPGIARFKNRDRRSGIFLATFCDDIPGGFYVGGFVQGPKVRNSR